MNNIAEEFDDHDLMMEMQPENHHGDDNVVEADKHDAADNDQGINVSIHNLDPSGGDGVVDNDGDNNVGGDDDIGDVMDIINQSLTEFLAEAQEEADKVTEIAAKKREEANAAEAEAEEINGRMIILREKAQALADDEKWTSMYERLRVWSREHGHCNPRRNWQAKMDAEEKGELCCCNMSWRFCYFWRHLMNYYCVTNYQLRYAVQLWGTGQGNKGVKRD